MSLSAVVSRLTSSRFLRFAAVGTLGFVFDTGAFFVGNRIVGLGAYLARALSIFIAMNVTWYGNRSITFRGERARSGRGIVVEWSRFIVTNAVGALINYIVFAALFRFAPAPLNNPYVALVAGVAAGLFFNFFSSKRFVFRQA